MAEKVKELSGNILISLNPVEENLHTGIIEGLDVLEELKEEYGLRYVLAINNDFICPLFEGFDASMAAAGLVEKINLNTGMRRLFRLIKIKF